MGSALGGEAGPQVLSSAVGTFKDPNRLRASASSFVKGASDFQGNLIYNHPDVSRSSLIIVADA